MGRWLIAALVAVVGLAGLYIGGAAYWEWFGKTRGAGEIVGASVPEAAIASRESAQVDVAGPDTKRILFGDLHVHTTFSTDAFLWAMPMFGGEGVHPLADACDFARYCSQLDFFSATDHAEAMTPVHWDETKKSIRACNARSGNAAAPDMVSFVGFEWSQVGRTPSDHYGHKNVIFEGLEDSAIAARAIAAAGVATQALRGSPLGLNRWIPFLDWKHRQDYFDFQQMTKEIRNVPDCDGSKPSNELSRDCFEAAANPGELVRKLQEQNLRYLLIPHGTSWGFYTPPGTTFDKQLHADMRPEKQTLIEVSSGHGNSEEFRPWREILPSADGKSATCPAPSDTYEPACWRAGEIIRARCIAAGDSAEACDARALDTRNKAANLGVAYHLIVSGETPEEWLDSGQCRDCWQPPFSHRPRTSVQYGLAIRNFDDPAHPVGFRWGFIGSSDNHRARPGTGYKPVDRMRQTESSGVDNDEWRQRVVGPTQEALAAATGVTQQSLQNLSGFQLTEGERQASFFTTGSLAAVHTEGRTREQIFAALERREVYATSGPRILLWFDLVNAPEGRTLKSVPMGGETIMSSPPRFRVRAVGDFVQKPGCPSFAEQGLPADRLKKLCAGECYNPGDARHKILRIEVIRIRPQITPDEPVESLVEDVWQTLPCNDVGTGCTAEFTDPHFRGRQARGGLLCPRHPGSDATHKRGPAASDARRQRRDHGGQPVSWGLPHAANRQLCGGCRGARLVVADLCERGAAMRLSRDALYLAAGVAGLAAAAFGAIGTPRLDALGIGAVATVDGRPISREAADRAVQALSNDKRNAVTDQDQRDGLERLIEEELLVQRGVALGLAETDLAARKAIVQSVLQLAIAERAGDAPDEATLKSFYADNVGMFAPAPRLRATLVFVRRDGQAPARVEATRAALEAGRPGADLGDPQALSLPHALLTPTELRTYLGAPLATLAARADVGAILVTDGADGWRLLRIDAKAPALPSRYEDVAAEVRAEWDRRADEAAVRAYIERLKRRSRITRAA